MSGSARPIYFDTNFFIQAVEGLPEIAAPAIALIDALKTREAGRAITSEITLAEVLATPKRDGAAPLSIKRRAYLDLLLWSNIFTLIPVAREVLLETADLRANLTFKLPDAIHVVSALRSGCSLFVSTDKDFDRTLPALDVNCDKKGLPRLLQEIA